MRPRSLIFTAPLLMAGCHPQSAIRPPVFYGRESVGPGSPKARLLLPDPAEIPENLKRRHRTMYNRTEAETSLVIHDCSLSSKDRWCDDPDLSFQKMLTRAARYANVNPEDTFKQWVAAADADPAPRLASTIQGFGYNGTLTSAPFQLLAVVNRLDLGSWDSAQKAWMLPEVRFIYGIRGDPTGVPPLFGLILEFVIPKLSWPQYRHYARAWQLHAGPGFTKGVKKAALQWIDNPALIRLRTNSSLLGGSSWSFGQWEFDNINHFRRRPLTDEINDACLNETLGCSAYQTAAYQKVWSELLKAGDGTTSYPIDPSSGLLLTTASTALIYCGSATSASIGMTVPSFVTGGYKNARSILSLQQCAFCHARETNQEPAQVSNRKPKENIAQLSRFLSGSSDSSDPNIHPPYDKIGAGDPSSVYISQVAFRAPGVGPCGNSDSRSFNDVARRTLFFAGILAGKKDSAPEHGQIDLLRLYAPDFTH